jgi:polysaccharide pyruvyl transferase WcaK-like protein
VDTRHSPRIALFGLFGVDNFGSDASLETTLHFLKRVCPDAQLTCICPNPEAIERTLSVASDSFSLTSIACNLPSPSNKLFRIFDRLLLRLPRAIDLIIRTIRKAREFDFLIVPGNGVLEEEPDRALTTLKWTLFLWCLAARINRKPIAFVSIGASPIQRRFVRWMLIAAFRMAHYRSFRDERSKQCVRDMGVDLVFGVPSLPERAAPRAAHGRSLTVGLGLMSFVRWYSDELHWSYVNKMVEFSLFLVRNGHRVRLLVADKADYRAVDDFIRIILMKDRSLLGHSVIAEHIVGTPDLLRQMALTDIVVCTRFHNVVYALRLGKPVIPVNYAKKHGALLDAFGLGKFAHPVQQMDVALLEEQFLELSRDLEMYERGVQEADARFQELRRKEELIFAARFLGQGREA